MVLPCPPGTYSAKCIAAVAFNAGLKDKKKLEMATAIALAESSGRTGVYNGICCVGLWQINIKAHRQYSMAQMKDPQQNATAMFKISNGGSNWQPWEVYTKRTYLLHMPQAKRGVSQLEKELESQGYSLEDGGGLLPNPLEPLEGVTDMIQFPSKVLAWISNRDNIFRVLKVSSGILMVGIGILVVARPVIEPVVRTVIGKAKSVATRGIA